MPLTRNRAAAVLALLVLTATPFGGAAPVPPVEDPTALAGPALADAMAAAEAAVAEAERQVADAQALAEQTVDGAQEMTYQQVAEALLALAQAQAQLELLAVQAACENYRGVMAASALEVWTNCNMGPGSGLDADFLDGISSEAFLARIDAEALARLTGDDALRARLDALDLQVEERAWAGVLARDGAGSTLDADTLDGLDSARFVQFAPNGNVGIGTTSPSEKLVVADNNPQGARLSIVNNEASGRRWDLASLGSSGAHSGKFTIADINADAHRLVIDTSGNVGIGTASPAAALHVKTVAGQRSAFLEGTSPQTYTELGFRMDGQDRGFLQWDEETDKLRLFAGGGRGPDLQMVVGADGKVGIGPGNTAPVATLHVQGSNSAPAFMVNSGNSELRMNAATSVSGTNPQYDFTANAPVNGKILRVADTSGNGDKLFIDAHGPNGNHFGITNALSFGGNGGRWAVGSLTANDLTLTTDNLDRVVVKAGSGNVGLGTNAPRSQLSVVGSQIQVAKSYADTSVAPVGVRVSDSYLHLGGQEFGTGSHRLVTFGYRAGGSTQSPAYLGFQETATSDAGGGATRGDLVFGTRPDANPLGSPLERVRITARGNVGIGTAEPNSTLEVNGYVQLARVAGAPPAGDCDSAAERGRMKVDSAAGLLYVCMDSGWVGK